MSGTGHQAAAPDIARSLTDPRAYAEPTTLLGNFAWLRANDPVALIETPTFDPFWAVTRHADIMQVGRDKALFHNGDRQTTLADRAGAARVRELTGGTHLVRTLVHMDDPDHIKYRQLTQSWFMPGQLRKLEPQIRALARRTVDEMAARGGACDFAVDVAALYPLRVIMLILGLPPEDEPRMLKLTQELFGNQDADLTRGAAGLSDIFARIMLTGSKFQTYQKTFRKILVRRSRKLSNFVRWLLHYLDEAKSMIYEELGAPNEPPTEDIAEDFE